MAVRTSDRCVTEGLAFAVLKKAVTVVERERQLRRGDASRAELDEALEVLERDVGRLRSAVGS